MDILEPAPQQTEEEIRAAKKLLNAQKRQAKKDKKQFIAMMKGKQLLQNELIREEKYDNTTYKKAFDDWIDMMDQIKMKQLRQEMEQTIAFVNQVVDRKNNLIERLQEDRKEAAAQFQRAVQGHMDCTQQNLELFQFLNKCLYDSYDRDQDRMLTNFRDDMNYRTRLFDRSKENIESQMHANTLVLLNSINNIDVRLRLNNQNDDEFTHYTLLTQMCKKFDEGNNAQKLIEIPSQQKRKQYAELVSKYDADTVQLDEIYRKQQSYRNHIEKLKAHFTDIQSSTTSKLAELQQELDYFHHTHNYLYRQYMIDINKDNTTIGLLALLSHQVVEALKSHIKKGESLLGTMTMCRKYQTEKEVVLARPTRSEMEKMDFYKTSFPESFEDLSHVSNMEFFWHKVALAQRHCAALEEEKDKLTEENNQLISLLHKYCQSVKYQRAIESLEISEMPTVTVPRQEAQTMFIKNKTVAALEVRAISLNPKPKPK